LDENWLDEYDEYEDDELAATETVPKSGIMSRLFGVFYAPVKLFTSIRVHGGAVAPLLMTLLLCVLFGVLSYWYRPIEMRETYAMAMERFDKQYVEIIRAQVGEGNKPSDLILAGATLFGTSILGAVVSAVIGFLVLKICKSEIGFGKLFTMFLTIGTVELFGQLLSAGMSIAAFTTMNVFSLAIFLPNPAAAGYFVLNNVTVFLFCGAGLTAAGIVVLSGLPKVKAVTAACIVLLLTYGVNLLLATRTSDPLASYELGYRVMNMIR